MGDSINIRVFPFIIRYLWEDTANQKRKKIQTIKQIC